MSELDGQGSLRSKARSGPLMSEYSNKRELKTRKRESEVWLSVYVVAQWQRAGGLSHKF